MTATYDAALETIEIVPTTPSSRLILEIQDVERVRRFAIGQRAIVVGSSQVAADIVVADRTVSGRHCQISLQDGGFKVVDLGSKNGTWVGGARVREAVGGEGMVVLVGQTTMVAIAESDVGEPVDENAAPLPGIAGRSALMCSVAAKVRRIANHRAPVLIAGETGVGKELVARALHAEGIRASGPFVALNASTFPRELIESELFGHERGAFTGAVARRAGAFAEAEGGTLFLDEIGELPLDAQPKLLRALDGYEVRRVGASGSGRRADVRVVAATHVPLFERVQEGLFRRDLYHRLEVFVIEIPPLRARRGDILAISRMLLEDLEEEHGRYELTQSALALLAVHEWPGNVRELRNVLVRATEIAGARRVIDNAAIALAMRRRTTHVRPMPLLRTTGVINEETAMIWLASHDGNVSAAARAARLPRTTFRKLLARNGGKMSVANGLDTDAEE